MNFMWNKSVNIQQIGNYVYGLAVPAFGANYIVRYVGQASKNNPNRCFQHLIEAEKYLTTRNASNIAKVEMINYFGAKGQLKIIILAHQIPDDWLDTMENIYRHISDEGSLVFSVENGVIKSSDLTNIAATHNNKTCVGNMNVVPMTIEEISNLYATKNYLKSVDISQRLKTSKKVLYLLNRPGIQTANGQDYIGSWLLSNSGLKDVEWIVFCDGFDEIKYVFKMTDVKICEIRTFLGLLGKDEKKKCFLIDKSKNQLRLLGNNPYFDVDGKGWSRYGNAKRYL